MVSSSFLFLFPSTLWLGTFMAVGVTTTPSVAAAAAAAGGGGNNNSSSSSIPYPVLRQDPVVVVKSTTDNPVEELVVVVPVPEMDTDCGKDHDSLLRQNHPVLCQMLDILQINLDGLAEHLQQFARQHGLLVGENWNVNWNVTTPSKTTTTTTTTTTKSKTTTTLQTITDLQQQQPQQQLPVVFAHGMGDSCFNEGMIRIGEHTSSLLHNVYVTCIPTGNTQSEDTTSGYFLSMDASVDVFATKVSQNVHLQHGFHAIGFSQGNNVIRGYIARYNTPTVHTFLSINGVNAGEGTVPGCFPNNMELQQHNRNDPFQLKSASICDLLLEQASKRAYTEFAQQHSFQAGYWRDPRRKELDKYYQYSQLAKWNNEGPNNHNATLNVNYAKTSKFVWIKASEDSMVWPKEGEQWGCPDPDDPFHSNILPMNETEWYQKDLFGLKTAQEAGKNYFETFHGDHLQFQMQDFDHWVNTYLKGGGLKTKAAL